MPRLGLVSTLAVLGLLAALPSAASGLLATTPSGGAAPSAGDAAASAAYLRDRQRVMRAALGGLPAGIARLRGYDAAFDTECPGVLAGAPPASPSPLAPGAPQQTPESNAAGEFWLEALLVSVREQLVPAEPAVVRSAHAISRLRWSSRRLTRLVRQDAREQLGEVHGPPPNLCADARAWAATGFREASPATRSLVAHAVGGSESTQEVIGRLLGRFEDRGGHALARRLQALEEQVALGLLRDAERARL